MVLNDDQILEILKKPRNSSIAPWRDEHNVLDIYVNGGDVASELEKIRNYENEAQRKLREKVARSTKDKVHNLLSPINKVFNANGGSIQIEGLSDKFKEEFEAHIDQLPEGISMREWMESYWKDAFVVDPNSIILVETDKEGKKAYPTYKNINVIHDYELEWDSFKYLVLEHGEIEVETDGEKEKKKVYRIFDDVKDVLYYVHNDQLKPYGNRKGVDGFKDDHLLQHNYGFVPAIVPGGIVDKVTKGKKPFLHKVDEALKEYLRSASVFVIYKFLHLFPKWWYHAMKCVTCEGQGQIANPNVDERTTKPYITCPTCHGSRLKKVTDVSDGISLPIPKEGQPMLGNNVAGYIDTPINAWKQMKEDLQDSEKDMQFTLWGAYLVDQEDKEKTAYETHINVQPINEQLHSVSRCGETKESQLLTFMAQIMYKKEAKVDSRWGKRFLIETPDALWKKYMEAKEKQAPVTTLDYHYEQYLMAEFQNDLTMLEKRKKIFSIEPYPHYKLMDMVNEEQKNKKLVFSQWINTDIDLDLEADKLKADFEKYYSENKPEIAGNVNQNQINENS
ncbi:hypothetical protein [Christiangramia crocea]|uniref:Uncharacterized protein n=1 Tax=Christiangramia crocea TaxID=2904124 RepID=A0A9X1UVD0_9FLAO|nr:hypothetical protein [Gramella crocea]MCG9971000.1 hypothetical protein [Gramella crocea]